MAVVKRCVQKGQWNYAVQIYMLQDKTSPKLTHIQKQKCVHLVRLLRLLFLLSKGHDFIQKWWLLKEPFGRCNLSFTPDTACLFFQLCRITYTDFFSASYMTAWGLSMCIYSARFFLFKGQVQWDVRRWSLAPHLYCLPLMMVTLPPASGNRFLASSTRASSSCSSCSFSTASP